MSGLGFRTLFTVTSSGSSSERLPLPFIDGHFLLQRIFPLSPSLRSVFPFSAFLFCCCSLTILPPGRSSSCSFPFIVSDVRKGYEVVFPVLSVGLSGSTFLPSLRSVIFSEPVGSFPFWKALDSAASPLRFISDVGTALAFLTPPYAVSFFYLRCPFEMKSAPLYIPLKLLRPGLPVAARGPLARPGWCHENGFRFFRFCFSPNPLSFFFAALCMDPGWWVCLPFFWCARTCKCHRTR